MAGQHDELKQRLARESEIDLSVKGRKSGKITTRPVWFVWEPGTSTVFLVPYRGADTEWYKNALANSTITIAAGTASAECQITPLADAAKIAAVVEKFRAKYGPANIRQYYPKLDTAATVQL